MSILGTSFATLATTASYYIKNHPIFGLESEIDEDIANEDALGINGDGVGSDV